VKDIPEGNQKELAQFLRLPLWHKLATALVRRSKIDVNVFTCTPRSLNGSLL